MSNPQIIAFEELEHEGDTLDSGFLRTMPGGRVVAVAGLGDVKVAIGRSASGKVRVEIDDTSEEPVYVSINAHTATADMENFTPERPWNER